MKRLALLILGLLSPLVGIIVLMPAAASAHPLGNFTVNTFDALRIRPERVLVDSVIDRAEIPTSQLASASPPVTPDSPPAAQQAWAQSSCVALAAHLVLAVDDRRLPLAVDAAVVRFPPGAGGLPTSRLTCRISAPVHLGSNTSMTFSDHAIGDRIGWHEVTAAGDGTRLTASDVPASSVSAALTRYPQDLLRSPLDVRGATVRVVTGGAAAADPLAGTDVPAAVASRRGVDSLTSGFTDLVGRHHLGVGIGALALVLAFALGALHAFAPGHGKTVMAAYLVSGRGSLRQAGVIGVGVTATHTAGVLVLGVVLSASASVAPERLYPWLGLASGLLLLGVGVGLLRGAVNRRRVMRGTTALVGVGATQPAGPGDGHTHGHAHDHSHSHSHGLGHQHSHDSVVHDPRTGNGLQWRSLLAVGFAGGLVPSPSALVVLLSAVALHRAWFGVLLVLVYGAGMATTLVGIGAALSRAAARLRPDQGRWRRAALVLPLATSTAVVVLGAALAVRAAVSI